MCRRILKTGKRIIYTGAQAGSEKTGDRFVVELNIAIDTFITNTVDITPPNYFEAPYMLKYKSKYYLMYSDGKCIDTSYKVRYSIGDTPYGSCKEGVNSPGLSNDIEKKIWPPGIIPY